MSNPLEYRTRFFVPAAILVLAVLVSGCALGTSQLAVTHDPLDSIGNKREGTILVREFVDEREPEHRGELIGNKRNGYGMVLGSFGCGGAGQLEALLTDYFADALREAGYNAVVEKRSSPNELDAIRLDAIVEGQIKEFWLDLYMVTWHQMEVLVTLREPKTEDVVWEKMIDGNETNFLWLGISSEFERVIRQALTQALNKAASEFSSDEFYQHVESRRVQ
jgi:hypothetical protein